MFVLLIFNWCLNMNPFEHVSSKFWLFLWFRLQYAYSFSIFRYLTPLLHPPWEEHFFGIFLNKTVPWSIGSILWRKRERRKITGFCDSWNIVLYSLSFLLRRGKKISSFWSACARHLSPARPLFYIFLLPKFRLRIVSDDRKHTNPISITWSLLSESILDFQGKAKWKI